MKYLKQILMAVLATCILLSVSGCFGNRSLYPSVQKAEVEAEREIEKAKIDADKEVAKARYDAIGKVADSNAKASQYTDSAVFEKINKPEPGRTNKNDADIVEAQEKGRTYRSVVPAIVNPVAIVKGVEAVADKMGDRITHNGDGDLKVNKRSVVDSEVGRDATLGNKTASKSVVDSEAGGDNSGRDKKTDTQTNTDSTTQTTDTGGGNTTGQKTQ